MLAERSCLQYIRNPSFVEKRKIVQFGEVDGCVDSIIVVNRLLWLTGSDRLRWQFVRSVEFAFLNSRRVLIATKINTVC